MKKVLDLDDSAWIAVFRQLVAILKADPVVSRIVRADAWQTWDGDEASQGPLPPNCAVAVRVSPTTTFDGWYSPEATIKPLNVNIDYDIQSTCINDPHNFWQAVCRAFYPPDDPTLPNPPDPRNAILQRLTDAGATTGVITAAGPNCLVDEKDAPGFFTCRGILRLDVWNRLNT